MDTQTITTIIGANMLAGIAGLLVLLALAYFLYRKAQAA